MEKPNSALAQFVDRFWFRFAKSASNRYGNLFMIVLGIAIGWTNGQKEFLGKLLPVVWAFCLAAIKDSYFVAYQLAKETSTQSISQHVVEFDGSPASLTHKPSIFSRVRYFIFATILSLVSGSIGYQAWAVVNPAEATMQFGHTALIGYKTATEKSAFLPNDPAEVQLVYENNSNATATHVFANCALLIFTDSIIKSGGVPGVRSEETTRWNQFRENWIANETTGIGIDNDIVAHDKTHFCTANTQVLNADQVQRLRDAKDVIYALGIVRWKDRSGEWESDTCSFYVPTKTTPDPNAPAQWRGCLTGHNATRKVFKEKENNGGA